MSLRTSSAAIVLFTMLFILAASAEWLEFGAGCPDNSEPLTFHNITLDDLISFDVEIQGLLADTVKHDRIKYLRFDRSPGTVPMNETGYPEVPVVTCFVAVPDESDLDLTYSANCMETIGCLPVYPVPLDSLVADSTSTPYIGEFFRKDSTAYASDEWYPSEIAEIVGEFMLRDQRVAIVSVHPVQYLASEDSLRVWSDIELSVNFTGLDPEWNEDGLGYYDLLVGDMLLGYHPDYEPIGNAVPDVEWHSETDEAPGMDPDYIIIVADGLVDGGVEEFAEYRSDFNDFDVLVTTVGDILENYGDPMASVPPTTYIRDYLEAVWNWTTPSTRPTYLLLIGDHEDPATPYPGWFLPSKTISEFTVPGEPHEVANDDWYVYFDEPREVFSSLPDMIVGRLSARSSSELEPMLELIEDFEAPVQYPGPILRRSLVRFSGKNNDGQQDTWDPSELWIESLSDWMGYSWVSYYCGDGEDGPGPEGGTPNPDGSAMTSEKWVEALTEEFTDGFQVGFYSNHGCEHFFSAGINFVNPSVPRFGLPDSCFTCFDVEDLSPPQGGHLPPFLLMLCCSAGGFNHTMAQHLYYDTYGGKYKCYCYAVEEDTLPAYDFGTDCLAETFMKNTECGTIGVLGSSNPSSSGYFDAMGRSVLEAVYCRGLSRIGDAVTDYRLRTAPLYITSDGGFSRELARFNLLGDPAVDIGDRVKFRDYCDLIISPADLAVNEYPTMSVDSEGKVVFRVTVRNAGWLDAGSFDFRLVVSDDSHNQVTLSATCDGLEADEETTLKFVWDSHIWFTPPGTLFLTATAADPGHLTPDSWIHNNSASTSVYVRDFYPNDDGWPVRTAGSVRSPVVLVDADSDGHLEMLVVEDPFFVSLYDPDLSDNPVWRIFLAVNETGNDGFSVPVVADVCGDAAPETLIDTKAVNGQASLIVLDPSDGAILYEYFHPGLYNQFTRYPHSVAVGDIITQNSGNEIAFVYRTEGGLDRYLQVLTIGQEGFELLDEQTLPTGGVDCGAWSVVSDMSEDASSEVAVSYQYRRQHGGYLYHSGIWIYDWDDATGTSSFIESVEWDESSMHHGIPSVGELPASGQQIALSRQYSSESQGLDPAVLLDPEDLGQSTPCEPSPVEDSEHVLCCIMADWDAPYGQADRVLSNAEDQCFGWYQNGQPVANYPILYDELSGTA